MDKVNEFIQSLGALAEMLGVFASGLKEQGFDREEIMCLCVEYLRCVIKK